MAEGGLRWVGASGAEGLTGLEITLSDPAQEPRPYTVRLYFAELHDAAPGQRVFSVRVQGREVLKDFDILGAAGEARTTVVREFSGVMVGGVLAVGLVPSSDARIASPILCGVEIVAEEQ